VNSRNYSIRRRCAVTLSARLRDNRAKKARWSNTTDVRRSHATASIVSADRIVFNIKGNDYRLVVAIDFEKSIVWIKWIGTHKDYDKIDVKEVQHGG
jgi:mRNA interferase HigB